MSPSLGTEGGDAAAAKLFFHNAGPRPGYFFFALVMASIPSAIVILGAVLGQGEPTTFPSSKPPTGYKAGPDGRGTLGLVWSCVSTIFTSIYVSIHLDVPNEPPKKKGRNCLLNFWHSTQRSVKFNLPLAFWMVLNVFAPGLLVLVASMEFQSARDGVVFMRALKGPHCGWKKRHGFLADMGGFEYDRKPIRTGREFYDLIQKTGIDLDCEKIQDEIRDWSNKNTVLKVFTFIQGAWFVAQCILRGVEHRAVSQLEVTTCAYIFSLMAAWLFWIRKPYHVNGRIPVEYVTMAKKTQSPQGHRDSTGTTLQSSSDSYFPAPNVNTPDLRHSQVDSDVEKGHAPQQKERQRPPLRSKSSWFSTPRLSYMLSFLYPPPVVGHLPSMPLPDPIFENARFSPFNRAMYHPEKAWIRSCFTSGAVGAVIGLIHLLPFWDRLYVNTMGRDLWRICGIVQVTLPPTLAVNSILERRFPKSWFLWFGMVVMSFMYCVSRFVVFALIWLSFASLPDTVYEDIDWSWFPHWF